MQSSLAKRIELLRDMALFRGLTEPELEQIAGRLHDYLLPANQLLYGAGDRAENFYLVASGQLLSQEIQEGRRIGETIHEAGDSFGVRALLRGGVREAAVSALQDSQLLYMTHNDFNWMLQQYPRVAASLRHFSVSINL